MHREAMSKPAHVLECRRCGMALPPDRARCPRCGQPVPLRFERGLPASGDLRAPPMPNAAQRPTVTGKATLRTRVSAALPRRLTAADPNGARHWGLSSSVAVILFGFAIGFGTYVATTEHENLRDMWDTVQASRSAGEKTHAAVRDPERNEMWEPPSTLMSQSSDSLVASLQQQIDSARNDDASDAARASAANDAAPQHGDTPSNVSRSGSSTASPPSNPVRRPARTQRSIREKTTESPASESLPPSAPEQLTAIEKPTPKVSTDATREPDHANTVQTGPVARNAQDSLAPRATATRQSARTRPVDRVASATPKHPVRRTHRRPPVKTARREPQAEGPFFTQTQRMWSFEMPRAGRHETLSQTPPDLYRGN